MQPEPSELSWKFVVSAAFFTASLPTGIFAILFRADMCLPTLFFFLGSLTVLSGEIAELIEKEEKRFLTELAKVNWPESVNAWEFIRTADIEQSKYGSILAPPWFWRLESLAERGLITYAGEPDSTKWARHSTSKRRIMITNDGRRLVESWTEND